MSIELDCIAAEDRAEALVDGYEPAGTYDDEVHQAMWALVRASRAERARLGARLAASEEEARGLRLAVAKLGAEVERLRE